MIHEQKRKILLTGYANDLADLVPLVDAPWVDITQVTEKALDTSVPTIADIVVFVMSIDACYSSQLHSIFVYVYDRVSAPQKCLLGIDDIDLSDLAFPELVHLPQISVRELQSFIREPSVDMNQISDHD